VGAASEERDRLIEAHLPLARRVARRYAGRGEGSDDLAQVGALALVRAVDRCDPARRELPGYLAACIDGELRHYLRDRAAPLRVPRTAARPRVTTLDDDMAADEHSLDEELLDRAALASAARRLDERERIVVLLVYFCDWTQAEAARELGLSQPQISRILGRAMRKLRRGLEGHPLSPSPRAATLRDDGDRRREAADA
jgi:RNA polymerase sigma-B factor